jgi:hypothetical protein
MWTVDWLTRLRRSVVAGVVRPKRTQPYFILPPAFTRPDTYGQARPPAESAMEQWRRLQTQPAKPVNPSDVVVMKDPRIKRKPPRKPSWSLE